MLPVIPVLCGSTVAGARQLYDAFYIRALLVEEEVEDERRAGLDLVAVEIGHAGRRQHLIVDQELAGALAARAGEDCMRRVGDDFRLAAELEHRLVADRKLDRRSR